MKLRKVPHDLPKQIYRNAKERYRDEITGHYVAVMTSDVNGRHREMALSYDENDRVAELITIHPVEALQKLSRIRTGRWRKL